MGRIIISREPSFYHSISAIKVYVDDQFVKKLHREGDVMEYPIQADSAQVSIREWGFKTKPVTVRDGQSVLISPDRFLLFVYFSVSVLFFILMSKWAFATPWPADQWNTPGHYWYRVFQQLTFVLPVWANNFLPLFKLEVMDGRPSGYLPNTN